MASFTRKVNTNPSLGVLGDVATADAINELQIPIERLTTLFYDVRESGAVGDGVTDDTAAIHAARDAAGADRVLKFTPGETFFVSKITASVADQIWDATGATIKLKDAANDHLLDITAAGVTILGGTWDQNAAQQSSAHKGIIVEADDVTLDGLLVTNTDSYGIWVLNASGARIRRCRVTNTLSIGIFVQATVSGSADYQDAVIESCIVDRSSLDPATVNGPGISVHGYATGPFYDQIGTSIVNNIVRMPTNPTDGDAICIESYGLSPRSRVVGNSCFGGSMGFSMDRSDHAVVSGNTIFGPKSYGIELASSVHCAVTGNTIDGNALLPNGISVNNASNGYNSIAGNTVTNLAASGRGIKVTNSPFTAVTGNVVKLVASGYAVELISADDCTIAGNTFDGQSVGLKAVMLDTCSGVAVTGNRMKNFTQHGVLIFANGGEALNTITLTGNAVTNVNSVIATSLTGGSTLGTEARAIGNAGQTRNSRSSNILNLSGDVIECWGTGTPESVVTAGVGSIYHRTDGGAATCLYVKESGTGNTGWVAK